MKTQRFNIPQDWTNPTIYNFSYKGINDLLVELINTFSNKQSTNRTMIEIGSYMGESTMMFASSGIFKTIHSIEPHTGNEKFNNEYGYDWKDIQKEYKINTRHFNNIIHHKDYSYNIVDNFDDNSIDFIYIDADHTYESVKRDIELYLPKVKDGGIIGGHDYRPEWKGVVEAVNEMLGEPMFTFIDGSWIKHKPKILI